MALKTMLKIKEKTLTKNFILISALFFFATASSVVLPAVTIVSNYAQNQKVSIAVTTPAPSQPCTVYKFAGQKVYQGCDINYSQFNTKSATNLALMAKLKALPLDRQRELNYQLQQTQAAILAQSGTWTAGWNDKMILGIEEQKRLLGLLGKPHTLPPGPTLTKSDTTLPDSFDWRNVGGKNYITTVKDQGQCGSCWAFGANAAFEGHIQAYYNNPALIPDLAEQDLVSCALPYPRDGVGGCSGAYDYQIENIYKTYWTATGNATETYFPYTATDAACSGKLAGWQQYAWKDLNYKKIDLTASLTDNINKIKRAIITNGPVNVGMDVYSDFFDYQSGIYQHGVNAQTTGGHSVVITGFGKNDGRDYWIVKNSWGPAWGENVNFLHPQDCTNCGYFRIYADDSNISSWFAFVVDGPNPPTPQSVICTDNDSGGADGYCYWGIGPKPETGCPSSCSSQPIEDCDDSNKNLNIQNNCGKPREQVGTLNIISTPSNAAVYANFNGNWSYRGRTPLQFNLQTGNRIIKLAKEEYDNYTATVLIEAGKTTNINAMLFAEPKIISPLTNDVFRAGDLIQINGIAPLRTDLQFSNYMIEWSVGGNPPWNKTGIGLTNDGNSPVENGILGTWDTSLIKNADYYSIRLTVNYVGRSIKKNIILYLDPTLRNGWPQRIEHHLGSWGSEPIYYAAGRFEPVVADINNDGLKEIIVYKTGNPPKLYVFKPNGTMLNGWPVAISNEDLLPNNLASPSVADMNNDGKMEIIVNGQNYLYIFNYVGGLIKKIALTGAGDLGAETTVADLNNDGYPEIIRRFQGLDVGEQRQLTILDSNGNTLPGWPKNTYDPNYQGDAWGYNETSVPAIGNLDDDSDFEVILASVRNVYDPGINPGNFYEKFHYEGKVYAFNIDGSLVSGFPVDVPGTPGTNEWICSEGYSPAIGDINDDGYDEIVIGTGTNRSLPASLPNYGLYVIDHNGNNVSGWPKLLNQEIKSSPVIFDYNNDGLLEISVDAAKPGSPFNIYVFDYQGNIKNGWPAESYADYRSPVIGDINSDNSLEIVEKKMYDAATVSAWDINGIGISNGFPKYFVSIDSFIECGSNPTISDIDNDGKLELIASSNEDSYDPNTPKMRSSIYVWNLNSTYSAATLHWPMFQHDAQHTGLYGYIIKPCRETSETANNVATSTIPYYSTLLSSQKITDIAQLTYFDIYTKSTAQCVSGSNRTAYDDQCFIDVCTGTSCQSTKKDSCTPLDKNCRLQEGFITPNNTVSNWRYKCPNGCTNGACNQ